MDKIFQQDLTKEEKVGGIFIVKLLFKAPVTMPAREQMEAVMQKRLGDAECFSYDSDTAVAQFAATRYRAEFKDGAYPPMLMIAPAAFDGNTIDDFTKSQMWDCGDDKDAILSECRYALIGTDMLAAALPASERAALDMDFTEALVELFPGCTAVYFENSGKLFTTETIRNHTLPRENRFIQFAVNVRFFTIQGGEDMLVDTLGMSLLFLPDIQYHFHGLDPNRIVNHAYNTAFYLLINDNPIEAGNTIDGIPDGSAQPERWICRYEESLIQPVREVLDIDTGAYAAGNRQYE